MKNDQSQENEKAFEKAAKYICTSKCGLCPMVIEQFTCPRECNLETVPWQCWMSFFRSQSAKDLEKV